ncbi:MFS transporter [Marinomonas ostreistagni]|uniref:MFS transporter n=1 Tax=Marinomonas ostreistagni TaxID=359209 RepID=A0ABS0Z8L5_9GAMM|nr:MFS transporter [Marinomonas ostreistagni]MBJ7550001.1 MFS transporter [Marinomonas ostreistagni]
MGIALVMAFNQVVSHGFGLFLFAALLPSMQSDIEIEAWHLAIIGAGTQASYLMGAALLGSLGHKVRSEVLLFGSGLTTAIILFGMLFLKMPEMVIAGLCLMSLSAALCWGGIVELISRSSSPSNKSMYLSIASSGTAWGYGANGLIMLLVLPAWGWQGGWVVAGGVALTCIVTTLIALSKKSKVQFVAPENNTFIGGGAALDTRGLIKTIVNERVARTSCLILFLVGLSTMPFSTWLNTYLAELELATSIAGAVWLLVGVSGMLSGLWVGKLSDKKGASLSLLLIFLCFFIGNAAFAFDPVNGVLVLAVMYGLMYFPVWGVLAGWVNRSYSSKATMQVNGAGMIAFGIGGIVGNLFAGYVQSQWSSVAGLFDGILLVSLILVILAVKLFMTDLSKKVIDITLAPDA